MQISRDMEMFLKHYETGGKHDQASGKVKLLPAGTPALAAYPDSGGVWTVGWGHTGKDVTSATRITLTQAEAFFRKDISYFEGFVTQIVAGGAPTTQHQFDALVSFTYNLGPSRLKKSTLLRLHRAGDYVNAADEFGKWTSGGMAGLVRRRAEERAFYLR